MTRQQRQEAHARHLGALLQKAADGMADQPQGSEETLLARAAAERRPNARDAETFWRSGAARVMLAAAALVLSTAGIVAWRVLAPRPVTYVVDGQDLAGGGYVTAPHDERTVVDFSDGSEVTLSPDARMRVRDTHPTGAVLVLERGSAQLYVKHRSETQWQLLAGPYAVDVVGTRFSTEWDPSREALRVEVESGVVRVTGGVVTDAVMVRSGQQLTASTRDGAWTMGRKPVEPGVDRAEAEAGDATAPGTDGTRRPPPSPRAEAKTLDWAQAIARGEFEEVVASAKAFGIQRCIDSCSPADLRRLADAARYTSRFVLAREALLALRRRDPGQRAVAAFLLATVSEPQGMTKSALTYYDTYLEEAPQGKYAQEARLARMRLLDAQGNRGAARTAATDYLARYPHGAGTKLARQILSGPREGAAAARGSASAGEMTGPGKASGSPAAGSR